MVNLWFVHVSLELGKSRQSKTSRTFYWRKVLIWNWSELSPASANVFAARNETTGCAQRSLRIGLPPKILILSWISLMAKVPTSYKSLLFGAGKHIVATIGKITRRKTQFPTKESSTQYMAIMIIKVRWPLVWPSAVWRDLLFLLSDLFHGRCQNGNLAVTATGSLCPQPRHHAINFSPQAVGKLCKLSVSWLWDGMKYREH